MGSAPLFSASDAVIKISAAAPSDIDDDVAAVTVPSLAKAARRVGILSMLTVPGVSSDSTVTSPLRVLNVIGEISSANVPSATAACARLTDAMANASCSSRVNSYFFAVSSA